VCVFSPLVLHGLDLESEHCVFENQNGKVTLVPLGGAQCSVNGVQLRESSQLNQGEGSSEGRGGGAGGGLGQSSVCRVLSSRCRHPARQDQHVSVQPSEGGGQAEGEAEGEALDHQPH